MGLRTPLQSEYGAITGAGGPLFGAADPSWREAVRTSGGSGSAFNGASPDGLTLPRSESQELRLKEHNEATQQEAEDVYIGTPPGNRYRPGGSAVHTRWNANRWRWCRPARLKEWARAHARMLAFSVVMAAVQGMIVLWALIWPVRVCEDDDPEVRPVASERPCFMCFDLWAVLRRELSASPTGVHTAAAGW